MIRLQVTVSVLALFAGMVLAAEGEKSVAGKRPPVVAGTLDFQRDIQPIFAAKCLSCHGAGKEKAGLRLDDGSAALKGSNSGVVIVPGKSAASRLIEVVAGLDPDLKMPPKGKPLTKEEIGRLRAWIDQGAHWPKQATPTAAAKPRSNHWAFRPVQRPALPEPASPGHIRNEIDAFILARLEKEGVAPSPEADRATLIRRLSLDLLGLPPSPREVDAFLNDTRPDAYEQLVDRLLASPHYGERWGRHWLDLARYADSDGYEKDNGRPYAWRYRSWVIEALNRDLPFDRFTVEQLAGDLLPNATTAQKIATGFHRNTLTNTEGGVDKEQFRVEAVVDRVNTTAKVFLGVTLGCAQCHDHKYDPFTQREYYQFFAFFNSDVEADLTAALPGEIEPYNRKKVEFEKKKSELQAVVAAFRKNELPARQEQWEHELKLPELRTLPVGLAATLLLEPTKRTDRQRKELGEYYAKTDKKLAELTKAVAVHEKTAPQLSKAQTLALGPVRQTHVMIRGDFLRPGAPVEAGTPAVLPPLTPAPLPRRERGERVAPLPSGERGKGAAGKPTRLDLAHWLVDPANPLTARVAVNWVWHKYFGRGLVATLEDWGTQGEKPSHPELLEWLATEFIGQKWSLKALHKLIVTSATYRQSSQVRPELQSRDPLNILLARQHRPRLEAEVLRDAALAASGLLNPTVGGPSVHPPQPAGISELTYAGSARWVESTGPARYRRGLYTWFQRTSPYPMLMTFDSPDSNLCCVRRERSNTPLQALTMMNDTVFVECAQALGRRILEEEPSGTAARIRHGFRLCVAREPSAGELAVLGRLFEEFLQSCRAHPDSAVKLIGTVKQAGTDPAEAAAWVALARVLLNLDEFVTRE